MKCDILLCDIFEHILSLLPYIVAPSCAKLGIFVQKTDFVSSSSSLEKFSRDMELFFADIARRI